MYEAVYDAGLQQGQTSDAAEAAAVHATSRAEELRLGTNEMPNIYFRESSPQHWERGRYHYHEPLSRHECSDWPEQWIKQPVNASDFNPYNIFMNRLMLKNEKHSMWTLLPIWYPTALLGNRDHSSRENDCTHYFGPGSAHWLWTTMLLNALQNKNRAWPLRTAPLEERWQSVAALLDDPEFPKVKFSSGGY